MEVMDKSSDNIKSEIAFGNLIVYKNAYKYGIFFTPGDKILQWCKQQR